MEEYLEMNEYQTPLTEDLIKDLPSEVYINMKSDIDDIIFIQRLLSDKMPRAKDLAKDEDNKIIIWAEDKKGNTLVDNLTHPHRLEDMDYFRPAALHFQEHGKYTLATPNAHPKSAYKLHWEEEIKRIKYGYKRESDGEWIPGDLYFYWNYCPIMLSEQDEKKKKRASRVRNFPKPWLGDYLFFHYLEAARDKGQHVECLKQRGIGWSYKGGSFGPRRAIFFKEQKTFYVAYEKEYLTKDGVLNKAWEYVDFLAKNTPFPRTRLRDSIRSMELKMGYKELADNSEQGTRGEVIGISAKDDPDKPRGKRGDIFFEEYGKFPNVSDTWNVCRDSTEDGGVAFSTMIAGGTGGTEGADFAGAENMFYEPESYNIMGLANVYDRNTGGRGTCGFFWGCYLNRNLCYDKNGMPDVIKALMEVHLERYHIKQTSSDPRNLTQRKAEKPVTPQEAIMRVDGTIFPVADLREYLEEIAPQYAKMQESHYIGDLMLGRGSIPIEWRPNANRKPLIKYPHDRKDNLEGGIEIYEMPKTNAEGQVDNWRYISGIDPIDDDIAISSVSLPSIWILDLYTDRIVAEYTGRPKFADDFFELARRLLMFYNAQSNYENNKKGLFAYFDRKNSLHLLCDTPQILKDMEMVKGQLYGNKAKGTNATAMINAWGRRLQRDWMLTEAYTQEFDDEGNQASHKLNMHTIRSKPYIEELIKWNPDGNFDRVSAMGMLMILREDRIKYLESRKERGNDGEQQLAEDPYFTQNYNTRFSY